MERDFERLKAKYDEMVTLSLTRRQAYAFLTYVSERAGEWNRLQLEVKKSMGITEEVHHEAEDGEEE